MRSTGLVVHAHRLAAGVERDRAAHQLRRGPSARPAQQRQQSGVDFFEVKRLGDVVVGARFEAFDLVLPPIARAVRIRMGNVLLFSRSRRISSRPDIFGSPRSMIAMSTGYCVPA